MYREVNKSEWMMDHDRPGKKFLRYEGGRGGREVPIMFGPAPGGVVAGCEETRGLSCWHCTPLWRIIDAECRARHTTALSANPVSGLRSGRLDCKSKSERRDSCCARFTVPRLSSDQLVICCDHRTSVGDYAHALWSLVK